MEDKKEKSLFPEQLVKYRKMNKLTQAELALKLNYSDKAVSKWERGESVPELLVISNIAEVLGVTVAELIGEAPSQSLTLTEKEMKAMKKAEEKEKRVKEKEKRLEASKEATKNKKPISNKAKLLIVLLSVLGAWAIAALVFFIFEMIGIKVFHTYVTFIFAIPVSFIVTTVFACIWAKERTMYISITILIISILFTLKYFLGFAVFKALIPIAIIVDLAFAVGFYLITLKHKSKNTVE